MSAVTPPVRQQTGVRIGERVVPRIGFAGLHLAGPGGWGAPVDRDAAIALVRTAVDRGIRYVDTADSLGPGVSEEVIATALHPYDDDLVIATKAGMLRSGPSAWGVLGRPDYLKQQAHASALRLRLDAIPLFTLHRIDPAYPLADQVGALVELRDAGVIREIGLSAVTAAQLDEARGIAPIAAVQNHFNLVSRHSERVLERTSELGIPFTAYWAFGHGRTLIDDPELGAIAARVDVSTAQLLIAWLLHRSPNLLALPGSSSVTHLTSNLGALDLDLDPGTVAALDRYAEGRRPIPDLPPTPETPREQ